MIIEFFALNGYGQFVWPAFIFTFISCFSLYFKTKKGSYFDDKELYTLTHVGTLEECLKLINGGYDGFKNRIVSIVSEAEKKKFRKTVGLQENRIEKSNKIALGYGLEIKGIK